MTDFALSPSTVHGFQLATAKAYELEGIFGIHSQGPPADRYTHEQMVGKARQLLADTQDRNEADVWACLSYFAAAFAGAVRAREPVEIGVGTGDLA